MPTTFVTHLESTFDGSALPGNRLQQVHEGKPLLVRYDLEALRRNLDRDAIQRRPANLWRWAELLPLQDPEHRVSLGERETPLLPCPRLGAEVGLEPESLWIKDESRLPGGSFKARGMAVAVSMARELGVARVAVPTAGNAGGALAAYAARAGIEAWVFMPDDTPEVYRSEAALHGARTWLVAGLIHDCARIVREHQDAAGWFDMSTLREPYRLEGKKTMGLELVLQLGWRFPDAVFYPTGGGTGLIGMWKAFAELQTLGWVKDQSPPRMYACQSSGCAPIVRGFELGLDHGVEPDAPRTIASGIRVPRALGDFLVLRALRESGGMALATPEEELRPWVERAMQLEGIALCPETAACLGALQQALRMGQVRPDQQVVVFNTAAVHKYAEVLGCELPRTTPDDFALPS